jgi:hypothetical protein
MFGAAYGNPSTFRCYANSSSYQDFQFPDWTTTGLWWNYGITWDGTNTIYYFQGVPQHTNSQAVPFLHVEDTAKWLALGVQHGSHTSDSPSGGWLQGSLADVRIYNFSLTSTNMAQLAQFQEPFPAAGTNATAPSITVQPQSQTNVVGANVTFSVTAQSNAGTPVYQWKFNGTPDISQTTANYVLNNIQTNNDGGYQVVVTNIGGAVTSAVATLTVTNVIVTVTNGPGGIIYVGTLRVGP